MKKNQKKIAIVHDVFIEQGGAERVLFSLLDLYPQADVFIPLLSSTGVNLLKKRGVKNIFSSFFNRVPFVHSASLFLKPFLYWYWESLDFNGYDVVISSSHSFSSKAVITSPETLHISYIHTSPRYLYTEFNETRILKKPIIKFLLTPLLSWLRQKDFIAAQRPDLLVANSLEVQKRIQKYYRRSSTVVYPPIRQPKKKPNLSLPKEYYLCFSRLAKQKNINLAILACNELKKKLVVVGDGAEKSYLKSIAGENVSFLGRVSDESLEKVFSKAKAMIYPSVQEDFGMAPVEALAHGVPIIGSYSGGVKEFLQEGKNGFFFQEITVEGIKSALKRFEKSQIKPSYCAKTSQLFSEEVFQKKVRELIQNFSL